MAIGDKNNSTNPDFWMNLAAEHIYNSADRRTASVEALKAVILWAFGIFSAGGFTLTMFGALKDFDTYALYSFGIAFFLLTSAYYIASEAQFPRVEKFKLGEPGKIADAYSNTVKSQSAIFKVASAITGIAFFFLAAGLLIEFYTIKNNNQQQTIVSTNDPFIKAGVENRGNLTYIPVSIEWKKNEPVQLTYIKTTSKKGSNIIQETTLFNQVFYTDTLGRIFHSYPLSIKDAVKNLTLKVTVTPKSTKDTTIERTMYLKLSLVP